MANTKISNLTAITESALASTDLFVVVDTDAVETKKITVAEMDARYIQSIPTATGLISDFSSYSELINEDFVGDSATFTAAIDSRWNSAQSNGTVTLDQTGIANHPGVGILTSTNTGYASAYTAVNAMKFTSGTLYFETMFNIPTLSTASEEFEIVTGLTSQINVATPADGVYFKYDRTTNTNWLICGAKSSTTTATDSGVAAATGWVRLGISWAIGTPLATYYINGTSAGTVSTNLPDDVALDLFLAQFKTAHTSTSSVNNFDYAYLTYSSTNRGI